jgi:hypothetical protein
MTKLFLGTSFPGGTSSRFAKKLSSQPSSSVGLRKASGKNCAFDEFRNLRTIFYSVDHTIPEYKLSRNVRVKVGVYVEESRVWRRIQRCRTAADGMCVSASAWLRADTCKWGGVARYDVSLCDTMPNEAGVARGVF